MVSHRKQSKSRQRKSKIASAKKGSRAKQAVKPSRPKKAAKKKQAKKKTGKARVGRNQRLLMSEAQGLGSAQGRQNTVSGLQSGDLQGLSRAEQADSESVDELVEEGNLFEAGAVAGVEEADNADEKEVDTHEVPEDDVPEEYLDKD
jgi:hypothetical protein